MNSLVLVGLVLLIVPYVPWVSFSAIVEKPIASGMLRVALYSACSQVLLFGLRFAGPFSWPALLVAVYLALPFHLGLLLPVIKGVKDDWKEKLAVILVHLLLALGQAGALLLAWS